MLLTITVLVSGLEDYQSVRSNVCILNCLQKQFWKTFLHLNSALKKKNQEKERFEQEPNSCICSVPFILEFLSDMGNVRMDKSLKSSYVK